MDESFKKIKRKYRLNALLKSAICGVSFGLLAVGVCLLALKLSGIPFNVGYYVLIGVGSAVLCGGVMFLIFNPSDKKIAKRIDNEYKLEERAQTALAYKDEDGIIVGLQREDTATRLRSLPKLKFKFSKIWQYCAIPALAVALALSGILIPAKETEAVVPPVDDFDTPWRISQLEIVQVRELISNVKSSHLDSDTRTSVADLLEALLEDLDTATTVKAKDGFVLGAIEEVDGIITPLNNYQSYVSALQVAEQKYLSHAVLRGVIVYKSYQLNSYEQAQQFYQEEFELVGDAISGPIEALRNELNNDEGLFEKITGNVLGIEAAIENASDDETDEIYEVLHWFTEQLTDLQTQMLESQIQTNSEENQGRDDVERSQWQIRLDSIFRSLSDRLAATLEKQAYRFAMNKFVGNSLKLIFDYEIDPDDHPLGKYDPESPTTSNPGSTAPPTGGDEPGPGRPNIAAKDQIYDPPGSGTGKGGKYVTLDDVYYYYLSVLESMIREGDLTEEQIRIVRAYFDMLTDGFKSDSN